MNAVRHRGRRLHPVTWAVMVVVGGVLAYVHFFQVQWAFHGMRFHYCRGAPYPYTAERDAPPEFLDGFDASALALDVAWWLAHLAPPVILAETWARRGFRASLRALFITLTVTAVVLSWSCWLKGPDLPFLRRPEYLITWLSLLFTRTCALVLLAWLIVRGANLAYSVVKRNATAANLDQPQGPPPPDQPC